MTKPDEQEIRRKLRLVYKSMRNRCYNPNEPSFKWYGARGITVEWGKFKDFHHDMRAGYEVGLTLDRIDVNGSYSKDNCQWTTWKQQARNRRNNTWVTIGKETKVMAEWIELSGLKSSTVYQRIGAYNWPIEKALERSTF